MKKFLLVSVLCLFFSNVAFCEEVKQPEQQVNDNRATISIQKQPAMEEAPQKQEIKQNKWCIIIQVNGKVKEQ